MKGPDFSDFAIIAGGFVVMLTVLGMLWCVVIAADRIGQKFNPVVIVAAIIAFFALAWVVFLIGGDILSAMGRKG